jgi:hypothetical protein
MLNLVKIRKKVENNLVEDKGWIADVYFGIDDAGIVGFHFILGFYDGAEKSFEKISKLS